MGTFLKIVLGSFYLILPSVASAAVTVLTVSGYYNLRYSDRSEDLAIDPEPFSYTATYDTTQATGPNSVKLMSSSFTDGLEPILYTPFGAASATGSMLAIDFGYNSNFGTDFGTDVSLSLKLNKPFNLAAPAPDVMLDPSLQGTVDNYTIAGPDHFGMRGIVTAFSYTIDGVSAGATAVPEPESWILQIAGFAILGGVMRRRTTGIPAL